MLLYFPGSSFTLVIVKLGRFSRFGFRLESTGHYNCSGSYLTVRSLVRELVGMCYCDLSLLTGDLQETGPLPNFKNLGDDGCLSGEGLLD